MPEWDISKETKITKVEFVEEFSDEKLKDIIYSAFCYLSTSSTIEYGEIHNYIGGKKEANEQLINSIKKLFKGE